MNARVREKIADELARNDECGPGPVSRREYLDDADVILAVVLDAVVEFLWAANHKVPAAKVSAEFGSSGSRDRT